LIERSGIAVAAALTDDKREQTFQDEDPGPASESSQSIHFCNTTGKKTTESAGRCGSREEDRHAETAFVSAVPHRDVESHTREQATLSDTERRSSSHKARVVLDETYVMCELVSISQH
jgi:hypothetical protein